jgi:hypothetical protein
MTSVSDTSSAEEQRTPLRVRTWVAIVILVPLCVLALRNMSNEWSTATTPGKIAATMTEVLYGICGLLGSAALVRRSRWARPLLLVWAVCATATSGLAPRVWGGASLLVSIASAVAGAAICAAILVLALPRRANTP